MIFYYGYCLGLTDTKVWFNFLRSFMEVDYFIFYLKNSNLNSKIKMVFTNLLQEIILP